MKEKILIIAWTLTGGGSERQASNTANILIEQGLNVSVMVFYRTDNEYKLNEKVSVSSLFKTKEDFLRTSAIRRYLIFRKVMKGFKKDKIFAFDYHFMNLLLRLFPLTKFKYANFVANSQRFVARPKETLRVAQKATINVLQCEEQKKYYSKRIINKSRVIPNPIPFNDLQLKKETTAIQSLFMVGRITWQKNYLLAIKAMEIVNQIYPKIKLDIFGSVVSKEEMELIKAYINNSDNQINVEFMGFTTDIRKKVIAYDLFLMTSITEGLPNALLEAMASRLPVVVTNFETGAYDTIGRNNERGLVAEQNEVAVAEAILSVINNPKQAFLRAEAGLSFIKEFFNKNKITEELLQLIRDLFNK